MTGDITHVWVVNRTEEYDPLYVFVNEEQAREYAARFDDAVSLSEEVVMNGSAAAQFLTDTYEPEDDDEESEPDDPTSSKEDARNEANGLTPVLKRALRDAKALDDIAHILRDPEWGVGMLEDIAAIVSDTARSLDNPTGELTWMRH